MGQTNRSARSPDRTTASERVLINYYDVRRRLTPNPRRTPETSSRIVHLRRLFSHIRNGLLAVRARVHALHRPVNHSRNVSTIGIHSEHLEHADSIGPAYSDLPPSADNIIETSGEIPDSSVSMDSVLNAQPSRKGHYSRSVRSRSSSPSRAREFTKWRVRPRRAHKKSSPAVIRLQRSGTTHEDKIYHVPRPAPVPKAPSTEKLRSKHGFTAQKGDRYYSFQLKEVDTEIFVAAILKVGKPAGMPKPTDSWPAFQPPRSRRKRHYKNFKAFDYSQSLQRDCPEFAVFGLDSECHLGRYRLQSILTQSRMILTPITSYIPSSSIWSRQPPAFTSPERES